MLQHLNGRELTGPMIYKDINVPSNSMLKMPLFREFMFLWCSLILQLHSDSCSQIPLKNKKVGNRWLHLQCDAQTKNGAHHPLSSLQLLTIIIIFLVMRNHLYPINTFCLPMHFTSAVYTVLFFPCLDRPRVLVSSFFLSCSNFICLRNWV